VVSASFGFLASFVSVDKYAAPKCPTFHTRDRYKQAEKKDNDRMKMKFLLHNDKEEKGKSSPQKQERGSPSQTPSLRGHTRPVPIIRDAFFADPPIDNKLLINN